MAPDGFLLADQCGRNNLRVALDNLSFRRRLGKIAGKVRLGKYRVGLRCDLCRQVAIPPALLRPGSYRRVSRTVRLSDLSKSRYASAIVTLNGFPISNRSLSRHAGRSHQPSEILPVSFPAIARGNSDHQHDGK